MSYSCLPLLKSRFAETVKELKMFHQPVVRNQRTKGSKIKTLLQVTVLLAISIWLIYQIKHSYDKKTEYGGSEDSKLSKGDDVYLGRKGKVGSENVIFIDMHEGNFDESIETKASGGGQDDAVDWQTEEKAGGEALKIEHEESHDDISNSIDTESQVEKQGHEDDSVDSHISGGDESTDNGLREEKEVLRLPSQRDSDNSDDQNENSSGVDDSLGQNELPKDGLIGQNLTLDEENSDNGEATVSEEGTIAGSTDHSEIGENAMQSSEPGKIDAEQSDNGIAGDEASSNSLSEDQSNIETSSTDEVHKRETFEFGVDSDAENTGNNTTEDATADARSDDGSLPSEQNNVASTNTETLEKDTTESQSDNTAEAEPTENQTTETANSDTKPEEGLDNPSISTEGNYLVMPDSNEAPKQEADESQVENASDNTASEEEKTDISSGDELAKLSLSDEQNNMQTDEGSKKEEESQGENASDAEITANNASVEEKAGLKSTDELANLSVTDKGDKIVMPTDTDDVKVEAIESQGGNASGAENTDNSVEEAKTDTVNSVEEAKTDTVNSVEEAKTDITTKDEAASSFQSDEQTPNGEAIQSQGEGASEPENNGENAPKDVKTEPNSNDETSSESGDTSGTDSESSSSAVAQEEVITDPKATK